MLRQSLSRNTTRFGNLFNLKQVERSFSDLFASKLIKSDENLTLRRTIVPLTMRMQNAYYRTKDDFMQKQKERQDKANEHFALRQVFAPMIVAKKGAKKITKQKKTSGAVGHVGRLDIRVGRVIEVQNAKNAETLYLTKVDIGGNNIRSIAVGLAKFVPADQLLNQNVVVLCNIRPAPLKGHLTHGMIMCAKSGNIKEPLIPPSNSKAGDLVHCEDFERKPHKQPRFKRFIFDPLAADMHTNGNLVACYRTQSLFIPKKGNILAKSLKNANIA